MTEEKKFTPIQAYTLTFEELKAHAEKRETIVTQQGYLISSKDRRFEESKAKYLWETDVANAIHAGKITVGSHKQTVNIRPPKEAQLADPRPINKKGRPFSWSFSNLNDFDGDGGCALRYAHNRFFCTTPWVETEATKYGNLVHDNAEKCLKGLPYDREMVKPIQKYLDLFLKQRDSGAEVIPELEIVLDRNMNPLTSKKAWFSKEAWYRAKLDVLVIKEGKASYFDWKTGAKVKATEEQLKCCLAALSVVRPEIEEFVGKLIWTKHSEVTGLQAGSLDREDIKNIWAGILPRVKRMEDAWRSEVFQARPSGLCQWRGGPTKGGGQCPAYDKCEYHR